MGYTMDVIKKEGIASTFLARPFKAVVSLFFN